MKSMHFEAGQLAAKKGEYMVAPDNLKIITRPWRDWYAGYKEATEAGKNKNLTSGYRQRKKLKKSV